jgi:hypothetical protein
VHTVNPAGIESRLRISSLACTGKELDALTDAVLKAKATAVELHGEGASEVPSALRKLQSETAP